MVKWGESAVMERICAYLQQKKAENNLSWAEVAERANLPESTVRKIITGQTEDPRYTTMERIVLAVGGRMHDIITNPDDIQLMSDPEAMDNPAPIQPVQAPQSATIPEPKNDTQIDMGPITDQIKAAYEARIADLKEAHLRENDRAKMVHLRHLHTLRTMCWSLGIALAVVLLFLLVMIIIDMSTTGIGWLRR